MKKSIILLWLLGGAAIVGAGLIWVQHKAVQDSRKLDTWRQKEKARIQAGPRFAAQWEIAPGEHLRQIVIPGFIFPTKCLIYTHTEYRQANMVCHEASSLEEDEK